MAHSFPASIEIECIREIIALVRKGGDMTRDDKFDVGQHVAYFYGSILEWVRQNGSEDTSYRELAALVMRQVLGIRLFGELEDEGHFGNMSIEDRCCEIEEACDNCESGGGDYSAVPVIAIISLVVSVIKLLRDLDIIEPTPED